MKQAQQNDILTAPSFPTKRRNISITQTQRCMGGKKKLEECEQQKIVQFWPQCSEQANVTCLFGSVNNKKSLAVTVMPSDGEIEKFSFQAGSHL